MADQTIPILAMVIFIICCIASLLARALGKGHMNANLAVAGIAVLSVSFFFFYFASLLDLSAGWFWYGYGGFIAAFGIFILFMSTRYRPKIPEEEE
jgi:hypothetical protein